MQTKSGLSYRQ